MLYLENEAGYIIENLNPTTDGYYFAWDQKSNKMVFIKDDLTTVYYPEDTVINPADCWITVGSAEEAAIIAAKGYNLALERDITEDIVLSNVVSINTLGFNCGNVIMNSGSADVQTAYLIGNFGETNISANATNIVTSGTISTLNVTGTSATSVNIGGYVNSFSAGSSVSSAVNSTGMVNTVAAGNSSVINNSGVIKSTGGSSITGSGATGANATQGNVVQAGTKEDLDSIRIQVATGSRTFQGETVKLSNDVNLNGIAFTPISNFYRGKSQENYFRGTFDGQKNSILNFSTEGFSITGLNAGFNNSSVYFGESQGRYKEACYGLFATAQDATFKDLNVTCDIHMMIDNANMWVGDSVGGIVGCGYGEITFINCTVSGSVEGYDCTGGLIGRMYGTKITFTNCTNNATITSVRRAGGLCGGCKVTPKYENCFNNGNVTTLGIAKDIELVAWNVNGSGEATSKVALASGQTAADKNTACGYYGVSAAANTGAWTNNGVPGADTKSDKWIGAPGFTNNGKIMQGDEDRTTLDAKK